MIDDERALDLAFRGGIDAARDMTRRAIGGVVLDQDGVVLGAGPHPMPVLVNFAARLEPGVVAADLVDRALEFFAPRQRGFTITALRGRDDDLITAADAAGFQSFGEGGAPLMVIDAPSDHAPVPAGARIELVTTSAQVAEIADICADAYAVYGMPADVVPALFSPPSVILANHIAAVVAYDEDGPVATASAVATHGTAYVQWVGTRQRAFGRGLGAAVTEAVTRAGFELGASLATLMASPMGAPVYRRLGWRDVGSVVERVRLRSSD